MILSKFLFDETNLMNEIYSKMEVNSRLEETGSGYHIRIAVPGVELEEISVELDSSKNLIVIEVDKDTTFVSKLKKSYKIPETINLDTINVNLDKGVLDIKMDRKEEAARKKLL